MDRSGLADERRTPFTGDMPGRAHFLAVFRTIARLTGHLQIASDQLVSCGRPRGLQTSPPSWAH